MGNAGKVIAITATVGLFAWWLYPKYAKLKYRAIDGSANGLTGIVEWILELPGKTFTGKRDAASNEIEEIEAGGYTFNIWNQGADGFPVNFKLFPTAKPREYVINVGMMPVIAFVNEGWVVETAKL